MKKKLQGNEKTVEVVDNSAEITAKLNAEWEQKMNDLEDRLGRSLKS